MNNPSVRITKSTLSLIANFLWGIVRCKLMPTTGDNILGDDRGVLVASFILRFPLNFIVKIVD